MSKLANISSSPMLREYAQGAAQDMTSAIADFLAPTVPVAKSVGRYKRYNQKHRFHIPDTRRALGGRAVQIGFTAEDAHYNCEPHAIDVPEDNLESLESDDLENLAMENADMAAEVAGLSHEKRVIDLALDTVGVGTALDITNSDDVIDQIDEDVLSVIKAAKYGSAMGVGVLLGANIWRVVKNHPSVKGRFVSGNAAKSFAVPGLEDFSRMLISQPEARMTLLVIDEAPEGLDEDTEFLLDNSLLVFARRPNPTRRDPSFMKTFRLRNQWMVPGVYQTEDGRGQVQKMDWSCDVQVTNAAACIRRTVSI